MRKIPVFAICALLVGCATSRQTFGPDGRQAFSLNCSGLALSWGACYEKAGAICGARGYDVVSVNGDSGAIVTASPQQAFGSSVITRSMVVSCKGEKKTAPPVAKAIEVPDVKCTTRVVSSGGQPVQDDRCQE
jgi:hypothetical protein